MCQNQGLCVIVINSAVWGVDIDSLPKVANLRTGCVVDASRHVLKEVDRCTDLCINKIGEIALLLCVAVP